MDRWLRSRRSAIIAVATVCLQLFGSLGPAAAQAAPGPTVPGVAATTSVGYGYDISYPQCSAALPRRPAFGIVGVNGGLAYSANPCLATEYQWAVGATSPTQPHVSFYLNTGNPGPQASSHWPAAGTTTPQACDGSWSQGCAYDYGWLAAQDSFNRAVAVAGPGAARAAPWWLDVETANSWSADTATNRSDLQGAIAALQAAGVGSVGLYSTAAMWGQITGATTPGSALNDAFRGLPDWVPGARSAKEAPSFCTRSFAGGAVRLAQYPAGGFDADYACA